jgi:opacity protein-like surface antigen
MKVRNMNIKSLILGSAAALVACGSAQAADLPVAEPVDYVKVCDAYGAGYFFIPGTDTCLKIAGSVLFAVDNDFDFNITRSEDLVNFYTETTFKFTAREETELGTLTAHMEFDDKGDDDKGSNTAFDKAYIMLGGFYAGLTDSLIDFNAGIGYDDFGFGMGDLNAIGYKADMGNGVTAAIALEEYTGNEANAGTSMPAIAASLTVSQGWGSVVVGASAFQVRYDQAMYSTDMGYMIGGEATFNIAEGLTFGVAGGYTAGAAGLNTTTTVNAVAGKLNTGWAASAGLEYAFADNFTVAVDAGYSAVNDRTGTADLDAYGTSLIATYVPVKNLNISGQIGYQKIDYSNNATKDLDDVAARLEIERTF